MVFILSLAYYGRPFLRDDSFMKLSSHSDAAHLRKRGFIGRNKNAYFMRGMVGKKNIIPLDKDTLLRILSPLGYRHGGGFLPY